MPDEMHPYAAASHHPPGMAPGAGAPLGVKVSATLTKPCTLPDLDVTWAVGERAWLKV